MQDRNDFDQAYANEQLRRSQHPIRRLIKYFYLNNLLKDVHGATLDLGCGAGQLLARLPPGSLGLEINPFLIKVLSSLGMNVIHYDMYKNDFRFSTLPANQQFKNLIISHVLEHFSDAAIVMRKIFNSANRLGITRIIIVVPGELGYASDKTHCTFINLAYLVENHLESISGFKLTNFSFFPLPSEKFGKLFVYQELKLVYDKAANE